MFESDMPMVDSISLGLILHDWNLEDKKKIINRAFQHLKPKGRLIVIENIIDDERRENTFGLLMSLNMLVEFGDAFDFSMKDFTPWAREAGFEKLRSYIWLAHAQLSLRIKDKIMKKVSVFTLNRY